MKKPNRNMYAYAKQSPAHLSDSKLLHTQNTTANQTIYHAIIDQMDTDHSHYINKLVVRNNKDEPRSDDKPQSSKNKGAHERTKSYVDVIVGTPTNSKAHLEAGFSYRGQQRQSHARNLFFSNQITPTNEKPCSNKSMTNKSHMREKDKENKSPFLNCLDSYIESLLTQNQNVEVHACEKERRTVLKSRESSANLKVLERLENAEKRIKELKLSNHILETENQKLKKNEKRIKAKTKLKMQQIVDYTRELTFELENERYQRRKVEDFINDLQRKFTRLRPERKSMNCRANRIEEFLLSETTEQDEEANMCEITEFRPKSIGSRKAGRSRQSRVTGLTREEMSTYAERQLELSEDETSSIGI